MSAIDKHHAEWLSLVEASGPFLSLPVLARVFPQGLDDVDSETRRTLRLAHEEWLDNHLGGRGELAVHNAWIGFVLKAVLRLDERDLADGPHLGLSVQMPEHRETLSPTFAIIQPAGRADAGGARVLFTQLGFNERPDRPLAGKSWKATPTDRMIALLRGAQTQGKTVRVGVVTNGARWVLVHAPPGGTTTAVTWTSELFFEEPLSLKAFASLLGQRRLFGVADDQTLETLFDASLTDTQEVTDQLGKQVRRAVETLIQRIDRIDQDRNRTLLRDVPLATLYESAVTTMMRLVFLLAAEERDLLLRGHPLYDQNYGVSTLTEQLQEQADRNGEEVLERRTDAWSRLLATFRAVFAGVSHADLRLPAYGGSLFDPDRFPFLEGRTPGTSFMDATQIEAEPLAIDNRTVLHLLRAITRLEVRGSVDAARRLSFRALGVEQIGNVYEGLLDHTAARARGTTLSLEGKLEPEIAVSELVARAKHGEAALADWLAGETGRTQKAIVSGLQYPMPKEEAREFSMLCDSHGIPWHDVKPWAKLVRRDTHARPVVIEDGAVYVTDGDGRRSTGTHYTPPELTGPIVQYALEPLVYVGPAEGTPREAWVLRKPAEILKLRVCDLAMGSGAFLVATCDYLAARLVEAWEGEEAAAGSRLVIAPDGTLSGGDARERVLPTDVDERLVIARRYVADRCLYGVDINSMAVEMAKLSLWITTLQKDRPFTFVNHALRTGDALLGVTSIEQLTNFHLDPVRGKAIHSNLLNLKERITGAVDRARKLRKKLESFPVNDISDAASKSWLFKQAEDATADLTILADLLVGAAVSTAGQADRALDELLEALSIPVAVFLNVATHGTLRNEKRDELRARAATLLAARKPDRLAPRRPFHWALAFPEVMAEGGFHAFVGNPPFRGGKHVSGDVGVDYREYLVQHVAEGRKGHADLCAYFFLRVAAFLRVQGSVGLVATKTIAQGDSREVGLDALINAGLTICRAVPSRPWPGTANLEVAHLWLRRGPWLGDIVLNDKRVPGISSQLMRPGRAEGRPFRLRANLNQCFVGSFVLGMGFALENEVAKDLVAGDRRNREVIFPFLNGKDLNSHPVQRASRAIINFFDWPLDRRDDPAGYEGPVAADYPNCLAVVRKCVKPERDKLGLKKDSSARGYARLWWQYGRRGEALYAALKSARSQHVLVKCIVSNSFVFAIVPSNQVFSHSLVAFAGPPFELFALLQSTIHEIWSRQYGSSMRTDLRYTPTDCFETFPFPSKSPAWKPLEVIGERYDVHRREMMLKNEEGLTKIHNRFHDPEETTGPIRKLRELHIAIDEAVKNAYGWTDLVLSHGFHETKQGVHFTISDPARVEVLDRLLELNHARYAEEAARGLHPDTATERKAAKSEAKGMSVGKPKPGRVTAPSKPKVSAAQPSLLGGPSTAPTDLTREAKKILKTLEKARGALGKSELIEKAEIDESVWTPALRELKDAGLVTQVGEKRGARYQRT